jgi:hypothetical protein
MEPEIITATSVVGAVDPVALVGVMHDLRD